MKNDYLKQNLNELVDIMLKYKKYRLRECAWNCRYTKG